MTRLERSNRSRKFSLSLSWCFSFSPTASEALNKITIVFPVRETIVKQRSHKIGVCFVGAQTYVELVCVCAGLLDLLCVLMEEKYVALRMRCTLCIRLVRWNTFKFKQPYDFECVALSCACAVRLYRDDEFIVDDVFLYSIFVRVNMLQVYTFSKYFQVWHWTSGCFIRYMVNVLSSYQL